MSPLTPSDDRHGVAAAQDHPKGSIGNPLTEADLPFTVPADGHYWLKLEGRDLTQLPFSPAGSVLAVEVRRSAETYDEKHDRWADTLRQEGY